MNSYRLSAAGFEVAVEGRPVGAEIRGLDLSRTLDAGVAQALRDAWVEHGVLLFRGQELTPEQQMAFSRYFGALEPGNTKTPLAEKYPEMVEITNRLPDGSPKYTGLSNAEAHWHSDMSYRKVPPRASSLYARAIPPEGGDTSFSNMYSAYEELPAGVRQRIRRLKVVHDESRNSAGRLRPGYEEVTDVTKTPGPHHPLVRTHPDTKRKALFLGRRPFSWVVGLPAGESEELLDHLWGHATQERFVWTHRWRVGDLVLWDNRCTMHRRDGFDMKHRRVLHRTQIAGEPVY